ADTIKGLKELILSRMRRVINEKNIATDEFRIWKVSVPVDKVDILREDPSKLLKNIKLLRDEQNITSIGKFLDDHIQADRSEASGCGTVVTSDTSSPTEHEFCMLVT
ncbi:4613_t:CDS:2, partial [Rhizophagus irregularis]